MSHDDPPSIAAHRARLKSRVPGQALQQLRAEPTDDELLARAGFLDDAHATLQGGYIAMRERAWAQQGKKVGAP